MGYIRHDAIVFTAYDLPEHLEGWKSLRSAADAFEDPEILMQQRWGDLLLGPIRSAVNSYSSMVFLPDGSKEGWAESDAGDRLRAELVEIANAHGLDWAHVSFGGDDYDLARLVNFNGAPIDGEGE